MRYRQKRRLYSQNLLTNPELVKKLIRRSSICPKDNVVEIGPGGGIITDKLVRYCRLVIAIEKDFRLYNYLINSGRKYPNLRLYNQDFLKFKKIDFSYKVFSNIPFSITADIMRKLTNDVNFKEGYLIVQKEAAMKFIGIPYSTRNSVVSVLLKPIFDISVFWEFESSDFSPLPSVDTVMIRIIRKKYTDVKTGDFILFRSYVEQLFNREKVAKESYIKILGKFFTFKKNATRKEKQDIIFIAKKLRKKSLAIRKIKRTRNDRNWRKFG